MVRADMESAHVVTIVRSGRRVVAKVAAERFIGMERCPRSLRQFFGFLSERLAVMNHAANCAVGESKYAGARPSRAAP